MDSGNSSQAGVAQAERAGGRPTLCTKANLDRICAAIEKRGLSDTAAARKLGIHPDTVRRWKLDCPELGMRFHVAREAYRERKLAVLDEAQQQPGAAGWRAAAWELERAFPEDYRRRSPKKDAEPEPDSRESVFPGRDFEFFFDLLQQREFGHMDRLLKIESDRFGRYIKPGAAPKAPAPPVVEAEPSPAIAIPAATEAEAPTVPEPAVLPFPAAEPEAPIEVPLSSPPPVLTVLPTPVEVAAGNPAESAPNADTPPPSEPLSAAPQPTPSRPSRPAPIQLPPPPKPAVMTRCSVPLSPQALAEFFALP